VIVCSDAMKNLIYNASPNREDERIDISEFEKYKNMWNMCIKKTEKITLYITSQKLH
jgi:hypothetical protein